MGIADANAMHARRVNAALSVVASRIFHSSATSRKSTRQRLQKYIIKRVIMIRRIARPIDSV